MHHDRRGMTLIEVLISLSLFTTVIGGIMGLLASQQRAFRRGSDDLLYVQNLAFGLSGLAQELRTAGLNVPSGQPVVVYAGPNTFGFNADLITNIANNPYAVYYDPAAPAGTVSALRVSQQIPVPGSSPNRNWPTVDYNDAAGLPSPAEAVFYNFRLDAETSRTDDYQLVRQVNNQPAELIARNLLAPTGSVPFFTYKYLAVPTTGRSVLAPVPEAWLPLYYGSTKSRNDSVRVVTVSYRVTNGQAGTGERIHDVSFAVPLPNIGLATIQQCGSAPLYGGTPTVQWDAAKAAVVLSFPSSADELGGEKDVGRYLVYRRLGAATTWGDPYYSFPASGDPTYTYLDKVVVPNQTYVYGVAAQDCTPRSSTLQQAAPITIPAP